jgi:hypothetical protein
MILCWTGCDDDKGENSPLPVIVPEPEETIQPGEVDPKARLKTVLSFTGMDDNQYVLTLLDPKKPQEGANLITAYIHRQKEDESYALVKTFKLKIDPRMPSMGNHASPNNVDLTWDDSNKVYHGTVNFSMTGYWKINLILLNEAGEIIQGNAVTGEEKASSIYFEIEV